MPSLSEIKNRASADYPDFPIDLEDGTAFNLKSSLRLDDRTRDKFAEIQDRLNKADEDGDSNSVKDTFVDLFVLVSDDKTKARATFRRMDLAELATVMKMYSEASSDSSKS